MASKNIVAKGTTYNGVESVTFPVSGGGDATFYEISDTTASASDVLNSKYFYTSSGVKTQGTGTAPSPTLITKSITANGTYNASSDSADGYSSVTVNVSGGGDSWSWMGKNPTKLQEWTEELSFADLDVDDWTWSSSSATTLRAAQNLTPTMTPDFLNYEYVQFVKIEVGYDYGNWTPTSAVLKFALVGVLNEAANNNSYNYVITSTPNTQNYTSTIDYKLFYKDDSGKNTCASSTAGVNTSSIPSPSVSGSFPNNLTMQWKAPAIQVRGNTTVSSSTSFDNLDFDKSYYKIKIEVWRVDAGTTNRSITNNETANILNNGI